MRSRAAKACMTMPERAIANFDPVQIARSGQCFRFEELPSGAVRLTALGARLTVRSAGEGRFAFSCGEREFEARWHDYFDLATDYAAIGARIPESDAFLRAAFASGSGLRILRQEPWETLASFIVSQNNNIPRIRASVEKLCERFGERREDGEGAFCCFPEPEALACAGEDALRACGLGYRAAYLSGVSRMAAEGRLNLGAMSALNDEQLRQRLCVLPGVGPKVAQCVMLFGFHRLAAFPVDTWIRRSLQAHYPQGFPLERYADCGGVIQQYMFCYERKTAKEGKRA